MADGGEVCRVSALDAGVKADPWRMQISMLPVRRSPPADALPSPPKSVRRSAFIATRNTLRGTRRQEQVLKCVSGDEWYTTRQVAEVLGISESNAKHHLNLLFDMDLVRRAVGVNKYYWNGK
jgi:DNA-binding CsgD family transcriptional regulator